MSRKSRSRSKVSCNKECLVPDVIIHLLKLALRHDRSVTRKKRLWDLAIPKNYTEKYETRRSTTSLYSNKTRRIRLDAPVRTRSEQLSLPRSRVMLNFSESPVYDGFDYERKSVVNRTTRKSLLSMYSRLSNSQPPKRPNIRNRCTKEEWKTHSHYVNQLAKPKRELTPPTMPPSKRKFNKARTKLLAKPKIYYEEEPNDWELKYYPDYRPSKRLIALSKPKYYYTYDNFDPFAVKKRALRYIASKRIQELAVPSKFSRQTDHNIRKNGYGVKPSALRAKTSDRIKQLAQPKEDTSPHSKPNPYVSPRALRAKASKRLKELAKPKTPRY